MIPRQACPASVSPYRHAADRYYYGLDECGAAVCYKYPEGVCVARRAERDCKNPLTAHSRVASMVR
eukprot:1301997-Rhodomonas_salina.1